MTALLLPSRLAGNSPGLVGGVIVLVFVTIWFTFAYTPIAQTEPRSQSIRRLANRPGPSRAGHSSFDFRKRFVLSQNEKGETGAFRES